MGCLLLDAARAFSEVQIEFLSGLSLHTLLVAVVATEHNLTVEDHELHAPPVDGFFRVNAHADFIIGRESGRNELAVFTFGNAEEVAGFHVPAAGRVADEINVGRVGINLQGFAVS